MAKGKEMEAILKIVGNLDPSLQKAISGATKAISGIGKGMAVAGTAVVAGMAAATTAAVAFGAEAVKAASSYEQAFANASTLMSGTPEELQKISDDIIKVSNETGIAAEELSNSVYSALSAGIDQADAVEFVGKASKLAAAGFTDVDTAMSAVAKTMNAYGMDASHTDEIQKILIQTQNKGITTVGELGASLAQVTPTAAAFGVSFDQVGASLATMTAQGTPTAQATTQLNSLIAELGKNGTVAAKNLAEAAEGTEYAGMSFSQMQESGATLDTILGMIQKSADESGVSMVDMFSSIEAGKAALSIFNGEGATFAENLEAMSTQEDVVGEAYDKVTGSLEHQIKTLKNLGQNFMINVGQKILPYVKEIAEKALPLIEQGMDQMLPVIDSVMATVGPMLGSIADTFIPLLMSGIQSAGGVLQGIVPMVMSVVDQIGQGIQNIAPFVQEVGTWLMGALSQIMPMLMNLGNTIMPVLVTIGQSVFSVIQSIVPVLLDIASAILPPVMSLISSLAPVIQNVFGAMTPVLQAVGKLIQVLLPPLVSIINALLPILNLVINIVGIQIVAAFNTLRPVIEAITSVIQAFGDTVSSIFGAIGGIIKGAINGVISFVNGAITRVNSISITLPDFAGGGTLGFNIPTIPELAKGGFTEGISIAGEAGREAVISFDSAYRDANLRYWLEAGKLLGALNNDGSVNSDSALAGRLLTLDDFSLSELASSGASTYVYDFSGMQFNPTINAEGRVDNDVMDRLREVENDFFEWLEAWVRRKEEMQYA